MHSVGAAISNWDSSSAAGCFGLTMARLRLVGCSGGGDGSGGSRSGTCRTPDLVSIFFIITSSWAVSQLFASSMIVLAGFVHVIEEVAAWLP